MPLSLPATVRREAIAAVQAFFQAERDEHIGDLQAGFLLDAVLAHAGPAAYDAGVRDAQTYLRGIVEDLDTVVVAPPPQKR